MTEPFGTSPVVLALFVEFGPFVGTLVGFFGIGGLFPRVQSVEVGRGIVVPLRTGSALGVHLGSAAITLVDEPVVQGSVRALRAKRRVGSGAAE